MSSCRHRLSALGVLLLYLAGCQGSIEPADAGRPDAFDAGAGDDAADAGSDPGADPGADPGSDPGTDPGSDPGADPGSDPGSDPGADPGPIDTVTVLPAEIDDLLANPGIGHRTFHVAAQDDNDIPAGVPSTDLYARYDWRDLEPAAGSYEWSMIDNDIAWAQQSGQKLSFRIMPFTPYSDGPDWLRQAGAQGTWSTMEGQSSPAWVPHLQDPTVMSAVEATLAALGQRYNDHPGVGYIDISFWGMYGEWHISTSISDPDVPLPSTSDLQHLVDIHFAALPDKVLIGGISGERQWGSDGAAAAYAIGGGAGVFFD